MSLFDRIFARRPDPRQAYRPLYDAIVALGRQPGWYLAGVPDTMDGRFDMIAAVLSVVLIRLEGEEEARQPSVHVTELFIDDMDGQLRQNGVGDVVVGKHIGKMVGALGGRLSAYRDAGDDSEALRGALVRNIWRGQPGGNGPIMVSVALARFIHDLRAQSTAQILAGQLPASPI